ncbi:MAG: response regulator [Alphaproteobacteria bacterium]|jgi:two-component system chemotaxis response regulator CheY|nr:response regulator [Alphaproteobacteria bacterium]MDP6831612.1 response regulator [Alphaproteobacteria bacterium]
MKHKILVIDDEAMIRKTIRAQLEGTIYEIVEAEDGEMGIQVLDSENVLEVVVIICDVRMPKVNGVEAVAYFRQNYPLIPVTVLTGYPDVHLAVDFIKDGVVDYLVKPVKKDKLLEVVSAAVRQHKLFAKPQLMA